MKLNLTFGLSIIVLLTALAPTTCWALLDEDASGNADSVPPNIVVIFMDDLGYADIGPFGATAYKTPNLDRNKRTKGVSFGFPRINRGLQRSVARAY